MKQVALREHVQACPLGWDDDKIVKWRGHNDKEAIAWIKRLRLLVGLNNQKPRVRVKKWIQWFDNLKPGDKVTVQFPWEDAKVRGGRKVIATVSLCNNPKVKKFHYRRADGSRFSHTATTPFGDCYFKVMPIGYEMVYSPRRGYLMCKVKS